MKYVVICALLFFEIRSLPFSISQTQAEQLGKKIWHNESRCSQEKLTWWKKGEQWASLGIGHFIWYPEGHHYLFTQTFPSLIQFFEHHKVSLPAWLTSSTACPWQTETEFFKEFNSQQMKELRTLLSNTIDLQACFIAQRLEKSLATIINACPAPEKHKITTLFNGMARTSQGLYALIDYLNFKGEGTSPTEQYKGQGWGLLQVFQGMNPSEKDLVGEFVQSSQKVLQNRVKNAPAARNEHQWLKGWTNRINTYNG